MKFLILCSIFIIYVFGSSRISQIETVNSFDNKAKLLINTSLKLQEFDAIDEKTSNKICDFANEYEQVEWIKTRHYKTPFNDDVADSLLNLSRLYTLCHPPLAEKFLKSYLKIKENIYSKKSEEAAAAHELLGDYYRIYMMDFNNAINHYFIAKDIREALFPGNIKMLQHQGILATTLSFKGRKQEADNIIEKAITLMNEQKLKEDDDSYKIFAQIGNYFSTVGELKKAAYYLEAAHSALKSFENEEHINILNELSSVYLNLDNIDNALEYAVKAYGMASSISSWLLPRTIVELIGIYEIKKNNVAIKRLKKEYEILKKIILTN